MHHPSPILKATVLLSPPLLHTLWIRLRRQESRSDIRGRHLWKQQVQQRQLYTVLVGFTLTLVLCQKASSTWGKDTDWVKNDPRIPQNTKKCHAWGIFVLWLTRLRLSWLGKRCRHTRAVQTFLQGSSLFYLVVSGLHRPQSCTEDSSCERGRSAPLRWSRQLRETSFCSGEPRWCRVQRRFSQFPLF